jgi:hypothetical protein
MKDAIQKNGNRQVAMTPRQAAERYGLSEGTLANWRCNKRGPKYYLLPPGRRKVIYLVDDLENWLRQNPVVTYESD